MSYQDNSPTASTNKSKRTWLITFGVLLVGVLLALLGWVLSAQWLFLLGAIVVMAGMIAVIIRGDAARLRRRGFLGEERDED